MSRMSSGAWICSGCSESGVGDGGFIAGSGMALSSRGPSSVGSGLGRVVVIVVGSGVMWVSTGSVVFVVGSGLWSSVVEALLFMSARHSCS